MWKVNLNLTLFEFNNLIFEKESTWKLIKTEYSRSAWKFSKITIRKWPTDGTIEAQKVVQKGSGNLLSAFA